MQHIWFFHARIATAVLWQ